jgi:teichoic acid transport system permease protein
VTSTPATPGMAHGLTRLGGRPTLRRYLPSLWGRRHFAIELARSRFRAQNEEDRLGIGWTVLGPLINAAVYGLIFGLLLKSDTRPANFVPFLVTGVFVFQFFAQCLSGGAKSIIGNMGLVRSLHFPRAVLPISLVLQQLFALMPMMAVLGFLVVIFGEPITLKWLEVPPALFLMTLFCLGVAFIAGRMTIHVRDLAQLIPFITRIFFYVSGIFFSVDKVFSGDSPRDQLFQILFEINPVHVYISLVRDGIVVAEPGAPPYATAQTWLLGVAWGVGTLLVGFWYFWRAEERYGRE